MTLYCYLWVLQILIIWFCYADTQKNDNMKEKCLEKDINDVNSETGADGKAFLCLLTSLVRPFDFQRVMARSKHASTIYQYLIKAHGLLSLDAQAGSSSLNKHFERF